MTDVHHFDGDLSVVKDICLLFVLCMVSSTSTDCILDAVIYCLSMIPKHRISKNNEGYRLCQLAYSITTNYN